mmetsp:Transcript_38399/g.75385  ORF Transcript_38399/g.75385 Transcript_38399/m.75385 type:complete len:101 (-) Transcript_38399:140-442(-)
MDVRTRWKASGRWACLRAGLRAGYFLSERVAKLEMQRDSEEQEEGEDEHEDGDRGADEVGHRATGARRRDVKEKGETETILIIDRERKTMQAAVARLPSL